MLGSDKMQKMVATFTTYAASLLSRAPKALVAFGVAAGAAAVLALSFPFTAQAKEKIRYEFRATPHTVHPSPHSYPPGQEPPPETHYHIDTKTKYPDGYQRREGAILYEGDSAPTPRYKTPLEADQDGYCPLGSYPVGHYRCCPQGSYYGHKRGVRGNVCIFD